ncbi:hypothetical protein [Chryseobacterium gambrini]|uniref:hypothetical protein n=1 Tax=Chryseobacterium gambrini TaxID=373672 RepID=UPI0022F3EB19|nr:hypothetical protein [Chryseobacterium gambrini]WBX99807.1 hypothetical protein PE065_11260 [Chryseobacterium gambrini]
MKKSYFLMLMALAFLLQGCRTENMNDESASTGSINKFQLSSKRISLAESKHKLQLIPEISKATTFLKSKVSGKTINNISIDTDHVTYIENGPNYHTYTFNIIKENTEENAPVENLVLTPLPDGTYKGLIFRYNFTEQEKQNILNGIPVDTKGKTTIYEAEGSFNVSKVTECNYVEETIWQDCSEHIHNQSNFGDWINCTAEIKPQVYTIGYWSCSSGGGGSESGSGNTGSEDGTGGGNAGNDNCITEVFQNPLDPVAVYNPCPIGVPTVPTLSGSFSLYVNSLPANLKNLLNNYANSDFYDGLSSYFYANNGSSEAKAFISWAAQFKLDNPTTTWEQFEYLMYNKTIYETSLGDDDNNTTGGYDTTVYDNFDPLQQNWPTIPSIIPVGNFIGWGYPGIKRNCMDYAKAQIGIKGFQISNYGAPGQTYQIYREQTGVNQSNLIAGLSYLKYALSNNIPVIVGVHDAPGHPGNADQTTDHFIVIVGMGSDNSGKYFTFYDNASGSASLGANPNNKLYYNQAIGIISGTSETPYANGLIYILTQIRKSKLK